MFTASLLAGSDQSGCALLQVDIVEIKEPRPAIFTRTGGKSLEIDRYICRFSG